MSVPYPDRDTPSFGGDGYFFHSHLPQYYSPSSLTQTRALSGANCASVITGKFVNVRLFGNGTVNALRAMTGETVMSPPPH